MLQHELGVDSNLLFDQTKVGVLWEENTTNRLNVAKLSSLGVINVYTSSGNVLRKGIGEQIARSMHCEHVNISVDENELTWEGYRRRILLERNAIASELIARGQYGSINFRPIDTLSYQFEVAASKGERVDGVDNLPTGIVMVTDTIMVGDVGRPIEKPKDVHTGRIDDDELEYQLRRRASGVPYLVSSVTLIKGTGDFRGRIALAPFVIPVRMKAGGVGEMTSEQMYKKLKHLTERNYPLVPGVVSHVVPESQDDLQVCLASDLSIHTRISHKDFFERPHSSSFGIYMRDARIKYGNQGDGSWKMNVGGYLDTFRWYDYLGLLPRVRNIIGASIAGCAVPAYEVALSKWITMVSSQKSATFSETHGISRMRRAVCSY